MTPAELSAKYIREIRAAVKQFGEYTYDDKGPREVMDLPIEELKSLLPADVSDALRIVARKEKRFGPRFIETVLVELQEWDKFDDLLREHEWLAEYF